MGVVLSQRGRGLNLRVLRAQLYYWNLPSGNPGSATAEVRKVYCAVKFVSVVEASKLVAIEVESRS